MKIDILTIFPEIFSGFVQSSLIQKACARELISINLHDIRRHADAPHFCVDDVPYGGGAGMVMKPEPLLRAIEAAKHDRGGRVILLTPSGTPFSQGKAWELSREPALILICGRYEGVDQRVIDLAVDEEISIGDFVMMGGEVAAMAVIEATVRLIDNVVGNRESVAKESFTETAPGERLLEAPHYTRPPEVLGRKVPEVLMSGNHQKIAQWRREQSLALTAKRRPDLLKHRESE